MRMVALRVITVMLRLLITMFLMRVIMVDDKVCDHGGDGDEEADNGGMIIRARFISGNGPGGA